jgi:glycosyltransferase involved in cell wall biosynthesis
MHLPLKICYVSDGHRQVPFLWRASWPGEALAERGHQVSWRQIEQIPDVLVFVRPIATESGALVRAWRKRGATVILDFDDLFDHGAVPEGHGVDGWNYYGMESYGWPESAHAACMECSAISCTTEPLAAWLRARYPQLLVGVLPNQYNDRDPQWEREPTWASAAHPLTLGLLGSPTHARDLAWIGPALNRLRRDVPDLRLLVSKGNESLPGLEGKIELIDYVPMDQYRNLLDPVDVVLAPLEPHPLNDCKSAIRLMEAGLAGRPYVASDTQPYDQYHGATVAAGGAAGWQVLDRGPDPEARAFHWRDTLLQFVEHPDLVAQMGQRGRRFALTQGIRQHIERWESFYEQARAHEADRWN